ncbi:hypothetical protein OS493_035458 [Desmophyllum pertusum]|uniref:Uncharacterized protein n=1 Tax=Desmophyllum pertusum TaxID=174260 RepID=A0A9X0CVY8_9CNID|nr:hypothetical protein OS493_035458 [Desmophyllum pertusum]
MQTSPEHAQKTPKSSTQQDFFSPRTSPTLEQDGPSTPERSPPQKSPSSAKKLKSFFQDLQRDSRHALTNKKAKIVQLWEGRRWRRMSLDEVEPFAEMEEKELAGYGANRACGIQRREQQRRPSCDERKTSRCRLRGRKSLLIARQFTAYRE